MKMSTERADELRSGVRAAYSSAAESPAEKHPFPVGREFALSVGYPAELIDALPRSAVDAFAGVSNVAIAADLRPGMNVLDLGCGAGLDSLIAAGRVGCEGRVTGVDFSESMIARATAAASAARAGNVNFVRVDAESLPIAAASFDAALVNGIFNLNPARRAIFAELARVLKPGGMAFVAELILKEPLPPDIRACEANWFA